MATIDQTCRLIQDPRTWPQRPLLFVQRDYNGWRQEGHVVEHIDEVEPVLTVYPHQSAAFPLSLPLVYSSVADFVSDGWTC